MDNYKEYNRKFNRKIIITLIVLLVIAGIAGHFVMKSVSRIANMAIAQEKYEAREERND